jgi:hypothetical protein
MAVLLYTPMLEDTGGFAAGVLCIKTRSVRAYIGFSTEVLAKEFCSRRQMPDSVKIIPASELGGRYRTRMPMATKVVLFSTLESLNAYFADPQAFPCEKHFVEFASLQST